MFLEKLPQAFVLAVLLVYWTDFSKIESKFVPPGTVEECFNIVGSSWDIYSYIRSASIRPNRK